MTFTPERAGIRRRAVRPQPRNAAPAGPAAPRVTAPAAEGVAVRTVAATDRPAVHDFLSGLSLDSAYRRFFTGIGSPSSTLVRHLVEVDHDRRHAVVATRGGEVIGLADCTRLPDGLTVELGVVIADRWQQRGLGPRLARAAVEPARARGATRIQLHALAENDPVAKLVRRTWPGRAPGRDGTVLVWDLPLPG